jgi:hypothetical protein
MLNVRWETELEYRVLDESERKGKPVIWCGDLNVAHEEIDLHDPANNHYTSGFTDEERCVAAAARRFCCAVCRVHLMSYASCVSCVSCVTHKVSRVLCVVARAHMHLFSTAQRRLHARDQDDGLRGQLPAREPDPPELLVLVLPLRFVIRLFFLSWPFLE